MTSIQQLGIYAVGDEDMVNGFRLAGLSRYRIVKDDADARENLGRLMSELVDETGVGIIILQEDYLPYVENIVQRIREEKRLLPLIVEVPSKHGTVYEDISSYYSTMIRRFVGFDIQI